MTVLGVVVIRIFVEIGGADFQQLRVIGKVILFTAPGVLVGGQIGPILQHRIDPDFMKLFIAILLIIVGLFLLFSLIF